MPELVPMAVLDQVARGQARRRWPALALFVDVAGFTTMTERLAAHGSEGAELLAVALRECFDPLLGLVSEAGGQVTGFAGDAFTVLFDDDGSAQAARQALAAAAAMRDLFAALPVRHTPAGSFSLALKLGLCADEVRCSVVRGASGRHVGYFHGPAIDRSAAAEHHARGGELVVTAEVAERLAGRMDDPDDPVSALHAALALADGHRRLGGPRGAGAARPWPRARAATGRRGEALFLPRAALGFPGDGELRDVTAVFVSFEATGEDEVADFVRHLIDELERAGDGALRVEFGDKGAVAWTFFGAPVAHADQSDRALAFARAAVRGGRARAGVAQGVAYAGFLGGQARAEFTCLGRPVNLAARLMARAGEGEVWCAPSLRPLVRRHALASRGLHTIKGFAGPVEALAAEGLDLAPADEPSEDDLLDSMLSTDDAGPTSLRATVQLDRLATSVRRTVQVASVLGPVIDPAALLELLEGQPRVADYVRLATRARVWRPEPDGRLRFVREEVQRTAYGMLPHARRRRLRVRADEVLAQLAARDEKKP